MLAVGDHFYLLMEHYGLRFGDASAKSLCNINETFNCAAVSASRYSEVFHVPIALWGIAANLVLLILVFMSWTSDGPAKGMLEGAKQNTARRNVLLVSGLIALTSVIMGSISMFMISKLCPFCMLAYALSFVAFGCLWAAFKTPGVKKGIPRPALQFADFLPVVILAAVALVAGFIVDDAMVNSYGARELGQYVKESLQSWSATPAVAIATQDPLVYGADKEKAKMTIVEFADFRCPHCKHAAPVLKAFVSAHPDTRLEFVAWPLDGECNTSIQHANGVSCLLARVVYCAQKNGGQGWKAHEYVYENQDKYATVEAVRNDLPEVSKVSGVANEKLVSCSDSPEAKSAVQKQAELGTSLNLQGTPTIFVNGRLLERGQMLQVLQGAYGLIGQ